MKLGTKHRGPVGPLVSVATLAVSALACEPSRGPSRAQHAGSGVDASNDEDCPATFQGGGACDPEGAPRCTYAEGACRCGLGSYCGGVPPSPEIEAELRRPRWICTRTPPAVRDDGCPGTQPAQASACSEPGKTCRYGDCCIYTVTCDDGAWQRGPKVCPP